MFRLISDIIAHWDAIVHAIVITIKFCKPKKIICIMMIISNHYGIKCVRNLIQLEPCNVMFNSFVGNSAI